MKEINPFKLFECLGWVTLGILICFLAYWTGLGTFLEPGAGFIAFASGLFIAFIGILICISKLTAFSVDQTEEEHLLIQIAFSREYASRVLYTIILLIVYALVLRKLGYIVTTFLIMVGLFLDPFERRWKMPLLWSLVTVIITYLLFETWLQTRFPRGILPWWY